MYYIIYAFPDFYFLVLHKTASLLPLFYCLTEILLSAKLAYEGSTVVKIWLFHSIFGVQYLTEYVLRIYLSFQEE